jgi:hypothetical protein
MKKNLALVLAFAFIFALAINLPVKAEENATTTDDKTTATTTMTTTSPAVTNFEDIKKEDRSNIDTSKYEKIPSPDYIRYFKQIIKKDGALFGMRIEKNATATAATKKVEDRKGSEEKKDTSNLEKIASPEQIKFFEKVTKIGNALFGIKKEDTKKPEDGNNNYSQKINLEKIASPEQIKFFERVTKVGNALFGVRKDDAPKPRQLPIMSTETIACVSVAIDVKDVDVASAFTAATAEIANAITVRGTCQKAALSLASDSRQEAINVCNKAFQETSKKANETAKAKQKAAWVTYDMSLKECAKKNTVATSSSIMIEDGGQKMSETIEQ